jgi:hypothetical protein
MSDKTDVRYEWLVETLDLDNCNSDDADDADIIEVYHADTYAEALKWAEQADQPVRIGLVRDRGNDLEGLLDRQWAYLTAGTMGTLPERFDWGGGETNGAKVPERFHRELKRRTT